MYRWLEYLYAFFRLTKLLVDHRFIAPELTFKSAVEIGGFGLEFCTAGVYHFVHSFDA